MAAQATASGDSIATASTDSQPGSATAWHEEWRGEAEAEQWEVEDRGTSCTRQCTRHRCRTQQVGFPAPSALGGRGAKDLLGVGNRLGLDCKARWAKRMGERMITNRRRTQCFCLRDDDPGVRAAAARALGTMQAAAYDTAASCCIRAPKPGPLPRVLLGVRVYPWDVADQ